MHKKTVVFPLLHILCTPLPAPLRALIAVAALCLICGCRTPGDTAWQIRDLPIPTAQAPLTEGDVLQVSFPGAPNLNTAQKVRVDGKVTLPLVGDYVAGGKPLSQVQEELKKEYEPQLQFKEVLVAVEPAALSVYVSGAVLRPGKITGKSPMSAIEAIMEAGGFSPDRANLKNVTVLRHVNGQRVSYSVNLKTTINGASTMDFFLLPNDIVYVPEKIQWF